MRSSDNRAFKEWAVVCRALAEGRQTVILRKGGISEQHGSFEVTDEEFLLFPTYLHQSADGVVPEWRDAAAASVDPEPGKVVISHHASVEAWQRVDSMETLQALRPFHIGSDAVVEERFHRWGAGGVYALFVRVRALPAPSLLPSLESYGGCTSWITLAEPVSLAGARPVLDDAEFARRLNKMQAIMAGNK